MTPPNRDNGHSLSVQCKRCGKPFLPRKAEHQYCRTCWTILKVVATLALVLMVGGLASALAFFGATLSAPQQSPLYGVLTDADVELTYTTPLPITGQAGALLTAYNKAVGAVQFTWWMLDVSGQGQWCSPWVSQIYTVSPGWDRVTSIFEPTRPSILTVFYYKSSGVTTFLRWDLAGWGGTCS